MSRVMYRLGIIWTSSVFLLCRSEPMAPIPTTTVASSKEKTDILFGISIGSIRHQDTIFAWRYAKNFPRRPSLQSARPCFPLPVLSSCLDPPSTSGSGSRLTVSARDGSCPVPLPHTAFARSAGGSVPLDGHTSLDDPDKDTQLVPERYVP
jgi:hypothetical protein